MLEIYIIINQTVWMTDYKMHGGIIRIFEIRGCHGDGGLFLCNVNIKKQVHGLFAERRM